MSKDLIRNNFSKRNLKEKFFKTMGLGAILISFIFLAGLMTSVVSKGYTAFMMTEIKLEINFDKKLLDPENTNDKNTIEYADYDQLVRAALAAKFPEAKSRDELMQIFALISKDAGNEAKKTLMKDFSLLGNKKEIWVGSSSNVDMLIKKSISKHEAESSLSELQLKAAQKLEKEGSTRKVFNTVFFTNSDSREAEQAGIYGAVIGSIFTIVSCMLLAFPLGVLTAVYLEEFAPKNRLTDIIEVNINNLAAVPSIVFGLLGLSVYINVIGMERSSAVVGGFTLALLILPTIVITTRSAIKTIPPSIRDAATAMGASRHQVTLHHILPLAVPGIMTGTILSIARALGETAPLLMIGMVAFVANAPSALSDPATALPVQIFLWADSPEAGFAEKTSAAIIVLLGFLVICNSVAVYLRKKFEVKW